HARIVPAAPCRGADVPAARPGRGPRRYRDRVSDPFRPPATDAAVPAGAAVTPVAGGPPDPVGDVVTGEAVVLGLRAASFASRLLGGLLDAVAIGVVLVALLLGSA